MNEVAVLQTSEGTMVLEFWPDVAPGHVENFKKLAEQGFYDGTCFHRVIKGFMIQGGCPLGAGTGGPGYTIKAEFNATPHEAGVLSMARTNDPNSAGSQFFICLGKQPSLDRQYTAFGKTADDASYQVVQSIGNLATDSSDKAIVRTIIAMAQSLGMSVIAEGVETEEQRQLLLDRGCTHYQGYLFGKPVPIEQFEALLKQG